MATPLALKALLLLGGVGLAVAAGLAAVKGLEYGAKRIMYGEDFFIGAQDAATDRMIACWNEQRRSEFVLAIQAEDLKVQR